MARLTGLEPATSGVTGRHSNQLSYNRRFARSGVGPNVGTYYAPARMASSVTDMKSRASRGFAMPAPTNSLLDVDKGEFELLEHLLIVPQEG